MHFDESLSAFYRVIVKEGCEELLEGAIFVRDGRGKLRLTVRRLEFGSIDIADLRKKVSEEVGFYSEDPPSNIVRDIDDAAYSKLDLALEERIDLGENELRSARLLDQRVSGTDWLLRPQIESNSDDAVPKLAFWSFKGGVGRSTALAMLAIHLATKGHNVLVIDLDLEAPGIGELLLSKGERPEFGILDYLIEDRLEEGLGKNLLERMVGTSSLVEGRGLIKVCTATGTGSEENPQSYLPKLFRAYPVVNRKSGIDETFSSRIRTLVDSLSSLASYSAVLVDARAGLNESTAAAVLGLGADVLLFGHNTPQTFSGYRYAMAHLNRFVVPEEGDWRIKLKMVHAKASPGKVSQEQFRDSAYEVFAEWLYDEEGDFGFSLTDPDAPHSPWIILDDSSFRDFDPFLDPDLISSPIAQAVFGEFLGQASERLNIS